MSSAKSLTSIMKDLTAASAAVSAQNQASADKQMAFQAQQNEQAMAFNAEQAQINRNWQERMSNTAHQREVQDLIKAGLNPVLSANAGASTPSGATASGYSSSGASANADNSYINAISSIYAQELQRETSLDIARINQQTQLETAKLGYDASLATANISAGTQKAINDANIRNQEYMAKYYPGTMWQGAGALGSQLVDLYNSVAGGINSSKISSKISNLGDKIISTLKGRIKPVRS